MSNTAAPAQSAPSTAEEVKPASGTEQQDKTLTGSGEVTLQKEKVADRDKPEDIESPEEWLKNAQSLNAKITSEAKTDGVQPPAEAEEVVPAEVIPPVEEVKPVAAAPAKETEELEEEPEVPGQAKKTPQHRIRATNPVDDMALSLFNASNRNGGKLTLVEAAKEAERILGGKAPVQATITETAPQAQPPTPRADGKPATLAETDAKITELRVKRKEATTQNLDLEQVDALTNEIEALTEHKRDLRDEHLHAATRAQSARQTEISASQAKAVELYPDCGNKDSALVKEMLAMDAELKEDGSALYLSPNKPLLLAQRAHERLKRLGALPAPAAAVASPQPVKPSRPVQPAALVANGSSRTTPAAPNNGQQLEELKQISSVDDYEKAMKKFGMPVNA